MPKIDTIEKVKQFAIFCKQKGIAVEVSGDRFEITSLKEVEK